MLRADGVLLFFSKWDGESWRKTGFFLWSTRVNCNHIPAGLLQHCPSLQSVQTHFLHLPVFDTTAIS